jgi:hypothetical protein
MMVRSKDEYFFGPAKRSTYPKVGLTTDGPCALG